MIKIGRTFIETSVGLILGIWLLAGAFWVAVICVAVHFIRKFW